MQKRFEAHEEAHRKLNEARGLTLSKVCIIEALQARLEAAKESFSDSERDKTTLASQLEETTMLRELLVDWILRV